MTAYSITLFVHIVSAMVLAAALRLEVLTLLHLRKATTSTEARFVMDLAPSFPVAAMAALAVLLLSGGYLTSLASAWSLAWIRVAFGALILIGPLGGISGRKLRAIRRLTASGPSADSQLQKQLRDPFLQFSVIVRVALVLGIVLLMTLKPEMRDSLAAVGAFAAVGVISALVVSRRGAVRPAMGAGD
jgi:hypothetical protein